MPRSEPTRQARTRTRRRGAARYVLRPVTLGDMATVLHQRVAMFRAMGDVPDRRIARYGPTFARWFARELRAGHLSGVLVETPEGAAVAGGLLWLQPRPPSPRFAQQRIPYVLSIYTEPAHRRRGLASRVTRALVATARRRGFPRVELHATEIGRPLYERLGFRATNQMRLVLP